MYWIKSFLFFSFCLLVVSSRANTVMDSLSLLPKMELKTIQPLYEVLPNGKHPSDYQFQIVNPDALQLRAWLDGDFDHLQGLMKLGSTTSGSKGQMFAQPLEAIRAARDVIEEVERIGNFISRLDGESLFKLPVGIKKTKDDGTNYLVAINNIILYPTKAEITVYAKVQTPDMELPLFLGSPDVGFSREGGISLGFLGLLGDFKIPILEKKCELNFKGARVVNNAFVQGEGTYVDFSCDGLEGFNLDVDLSFSREVIKPADPADTRQIEAHLGVNATNGLNDILVDININEPFVHADYEGLIWTVSNVVFDFSETQHSDQLSFPVAEYSPVLPDINLWKGIYIGQLSVELPKELLGDNENGFGSEYLGVEDVIIDHNGFSGYIEVAPVLDLENGDMNGWAFSMDRFKAHIYRNSLAAVEFDGLINIPFFNDSPDGSPTGANSIAYQANIDILDREYRFVIQNTEEQVLYAKMIHAQVVLAPTSSLAIQYSEAEGFDITATLNGTIEIDAAISNAQLRVPAIAFEGLSIGNQTPFIKSGGSWNIGGGDIEVKLNAFSLTVSEITMETEGENGEQAALRFVADFNLAQGDQIDLSATGGFRLRGLIEETDEGHQNWRFDRLSVDLLEVDANTPAFAFDGYVVFFEDVPQFGSGFQGSMKLTLKKLGNTGVDAMAIFGSAPDPDLPEEEYRYFLVDVMAKFPANVLSVGPMSVRGLGGGVYYHMAQQAIVNDFSVEAPNPPPSYDAEAEDTNAAIDAYTQAIIDNYLGESLSGISYLPDRSVALGVNAGVVMASSGSEEAFNANVVLNVEFNTGGGVRHIRLHGYANFMAPISWTGPACTGVSTQFKLELVFENDNNPNGGYFHAGAQIFINTGAIRGAYPLNLGDENPEGDPLLSQLGDIDCDNLYHAGGVDMRFDSDQWYINIGVPGPRDGDNSDDSYPYPPFAPIGVELSLLGLSANVTGYLDIGDAIPPFPGLPSNVGSLTGFRGSIVANESARASGSGFAFGLRFQSENEINAFGIFGAGLNLDVGFDLMLQKYQDAYCVNTGSELGINGWYAAGQAWAFVEGYIKAVGITIFDLALGAAIQLKGPNPTYGRASVGGRFRILGGLIKGTCRFPIRIGRECELEGGGSPVLDYEIIASISPFDGGRDEQISIKPNVLFNYPIDQVVSLGQDDNGNPEYYKIELDHFRLQKNGVDVPGELRMDISGTYAEYFTQNFLDPNTEYIIDVKASIYSTNAEGVPQGEALDTDEEIATFTTGGALYYIPVTNIHYAYPADGQFNYYEDETSSQFIQLERGQDLLLGDISNAGALKLRLDNQDVEHIISVNYDAQANRLNFTLPDLEAGGAYQGTLYDENAAETEDDNFLHRFYFRVSRYPTFANKMLSAGLGNMEVQNLNGFSHTTHTAAINGLVEPFGVEEVIGLDQYPLAVDLTALLSTTPWMDNFTQRNFPDLGITVNFYDQQEDCNFHVTNQNYSIQGLPREALGTTYPDKAVFLEQEGSHLCKVTLANYQALHSARASNNPVVGVGTSLLIYFVPDIVRYDLDRLQHLVRLEYFENYADLVNALHQESGVLCGSYCDTDGGPLIVDPFIFFEADTEYECDFSTCCVESLAFQLNRFEYFEDFYQLPAHHCMRITYTLRDANSCLYPFEERELYTAPTAGSSYPISFEYLLPNQQSTGNLVTKNIIY